MFGQLRSRKPVVPVRTLIAVAAVGISATATALFGGLPHAAAPGLAGREDQWTAVHDGPQQYPDVHVDSDVRIRMSDGIVLKADVYRPVDASGAVVAQPLPTIVNLTPYTKLMTDLVGSAVENPELQPLVMSLVRQINLSGTPISSFGDLLHALDGGTVPTVLGLDRNLIRSGYTLVVADVRGTGQSQGRWETLGEREQLDTREVIDWAAAQPFSNGKVAMSGGSYAAVNQLRAAEDAPAALRAIFPVVPGSDLMRDVVAPGGGVGTTFLPMWLQTVNQLKLIPDLKSIFDGTFDWKWLAARVADPATNVDLLAQALLTPSMDNMPPALADALDSGSDFRQALTGHPERVTVPTFVYGGWHDIFANSATKIYQAIPLPAGRKQLVVGDTYHANPGAGTGVPGAPPRLEVLQRAWFDKWLKDIDNGIDSYGPIVLNEQGGGWVTLPQYPQPGADHRRVYLTAAPSGTTDAAVHDGSLNAQPPAEVSTLTVAPGLATLCSRDAAQGSAGSAAMLDVCAKDSRVAEHDALTFTSAPVSAPTAISGPIDIHLETVQDATDGFWSATVNDVAPDGTSTALTTGQLTVSMRAVDDARSSRSANGDYTIPFHLLTAAARQPVTPGEPVGLDIAVIPTQARLQIGHRLRIDLFAANAPKAMPFRPMLNDSELKPQHLRLDPNAPSYVNLPTDRPIG
ncbi:CocE/NonD family hydrolase [Nocardia africana]|uniref:Cocaine esterase n=1 Tax=Nocardia africana TaxID=134964 RepID=A0A378WLY0_9NOCA|nr:CocE/NonD family hydrolase [Nocardia africana]MCC3315447.1 CocE/NonD family hydrolase [Nocardia africana]SUA42239.1 Cocaine esterase [Nocardia africana]